MLYPVRCILPFDRKMVIINTVVTGYEGSSEEEKEDESSSSVTEVEVIDAEGTVKMMTLNELGIEFAFEYCSKLVFFHEKDLRDSLFLIDENAKEDEDEDESNQSSFRTRGLLDQVQMGLINKDLRVQFVNREVNYGLFAKESICQNEFVGEYVGIVQRSSLTNTGPASTYTANYAMDNSTEVNAFEYGNIIRFMNHSSTSPNCAFRKVVIGDMVHIIAVTRRSVAKDEQLLVDYGSAYWQVHASPPQEM